MSDIAVAEAPPASEFLRGAYRRPTFWLTGLALNVVSGWQAARHWFPGMSDLGDRHGNILQQVLHDNGQHLGPSWVVGMTAAALYNRFVPEQTVTEQVAVAATASIAVNTLNEFYEIETATDIFGNPARPDFSVSDVSIGSLLVAASGVLSYVVARRSMKQDV